MKVLLVGSGGREHAIGWKLAQSPRVKELISLPGNPGLAEIGPVVEGIAATDAGAISAMARIQNVDLVVVGPEAPLAAGVVDTVTNLGIRAFGPTRAAARLESSKTFAKKVMEGAGVPTGGFWSFEDGSEAVRRIESLVGPYVVKADGLAAGKGVLVTDSAEEATAWVHRWIDHGPVVIEEYLDGPEVSVFAVSTPEGVFPLEPARDYKRLLDGDRGPNTGGMGAYSPVVDLPDNLTEDVMSSIVEPTLAFMSAQGNPFYGFLYVGLALTEDGPKVVEFNARLGDPEAEVLLPRLSNDLLDVMDGAAPEWSSTAAVDVVLAAPGYPESSEADIPIGELDDLPSGALVFQAGTTRDGRGRLVSSGGRVLNVVGTGATLADARDVAYRAVDAIDFPGKVYRTDIAEGAE